MNTTAINPGATASPVRGRSRARTALAFATLAAFGGVALATAKEKYPDWGDAAIEATVGAWKGKIARVMPDLCTGTATSSGSQSTREPNESNPVVPGWTPLGGTRTDGAGQYEQHSGDDTDAAGTDSFLYIKLVGSKASVFLKAILEAEDGAHAEWAVHYMGEETLTYQNGPFRRAERLTVVNPWAIGWSRRVVDFDAENGEYDETKAIDQSFAVRCQLIDGTSVGDGATFSRVVPASQGSTKSAGLKLKGGVKAGTAPGAEFGAELGFELSETKTYDTKFHSLSDESGERAGSAIVTKAVPCPFEESWTAKTYVDGQFSVLDHESFDGDKGSRQELLLTVINYIASIDVERCHSCGSGIPPIPPDPPTTPTDPPPTTPCDPGWARPITPSDPTPPTTPTTPNGSTLPTSGAATDDEPGSAPTPGAPLTSPGGQEPGWGGVPPVRPGSNPAVGAGSSGSQ